MKKIFLILALSVPFSATFAESIPQKPPISYKYDTAAWTIDNSSVCYNYKYGSVIYRNCRSYAVEYFTKQCDKYKNILDNKGRNASSEEQNMESMFCHAASTYSPVN